MFTKSGRKLVRIPIPQKNELFSPNNDTKQTNHVNGHINSMLDDLVSRGCTVTPLMTEPSPIETKRSIPPTRKRKKRSKTVAKLDGFAPNIAARRKSRRPELKNVQRNNGNTVSSVHSTEKGKNVFDITEIPQFIVDFNAFKAKDILTAGQKSASAGSSTEEHPLTGNNEQLSDINIRRIINGIEYVSFTPQSNVVKRDRLIQVSEFENTETVESAVQCDLIDDESSSESSQSDWINEIMEEYEFLEDGNMQECQICGEVCPSQLSNLKHSLTHEERSLLCFRCGRLFPNTTKLLAHEDKIHANDEKLKIRKALRCPKLNCLKAFHSKHQLFAHIDQHSNKVSEQRCSKCQRSFSSALQLLCHVNRRNCWRC